MQVSKNACHLDKPAKTHSSPFFRLVDQKWFIDFLMFLSFESKNSIPFSISTTKNQDLQLEYQRLIVAIPDNRGNTFSRRAMV